jgi:hypothetical protein
MLRRLWFACSCGWLAFIWLLMRNPKGQLDADLLPIALAPFLAGLALPPILTWVRWGSFRRPVPAPRWKPYRRF